MLHERLKTFLYYSVLLMGKPMHALQSFKVVPQGDEKLMVEFRDNFLPEALYTQAEGRSLLWHAVEIARPDILNYIILHKEEFIHKQDVNHRIRLRGDTDTTPLSDLCSKPSWNIYQELCARILINAGAKLIYWSEISRGRSLASVLPIAQECGNLKAIRLLAAANIDPNECKFFRYVNNQQTQPSPEMYVLFAVGIKDREEYLAHQRFVQEKLELQEQLIRVITEIIIQYAFGLVPEEPYEEAEIQPDAVQPVAVAKKANACCCMM